MKRTRGMDHAIQEWKAYKPSFDKIEKYKMVLRLISEIPIAEDGKYIVDRGKLFQTMARNALQEFGDTWEMKTDNPQEV